ncbi:hypothetical protein VB834_17740 [Limnoraphis robusta Tam1]|uniref:hypothetical protein n=1 Tax=Limnoraphis robusta TaxID=1118279 RepID=UPI002B1F1D28|nr:hypothetical protein [Limnoraphis robusta]MEA5497802.1 hypothetical protein [Limnoraphis robusta BA-68 BA1]MEA5540865.1 hypothetical protein [Limnoraphis robusta Tam1]
MKKQKYLLDSITHLLYSLQRMSQMSNAIAFPVQQSLVWRSHPYYPKNPESWGISSDWNAIAHLLT